MLRRLKCRRDRRIAAVWLLVAVVLLSVPLLVRNVLLDFAISNFGHSSLVPQQTSSPSTDSARLHSHLQRRHTRTSTTSNENWRNGSLFSRKPLVLLSIDYHQTPVQDLIDLIGPLGVRFIQKGVMTYGCQFFNSCRTTGSSTRDLLSTKIFFEEVNGSWKWSLYDKYRTDPDWTAADAFICFHPASICDLFTPFNKPIIVLSTIRVDNMFHLPWSRSAWLDTLRTTIAVDSRSVVAANNRFDVEYTRFFTGLDATLIPSYCGYAGVSYNPTRHQFLLYRPLRARTFTDYFLREWARVTSSLNASSTSSKSVELVPVHDLYKHHTFSDLSSHRGIVFLPVQPSVMAIFEHYRMNIPLFFPSLEFLVSLQLNNNILSEVNLFGFYGKWFQPDESQVAVPHPYEETRSNLQYWLKLCDWYSLPHVYYYDSMEDLAVLLNRLTNEDLLDVSRKMKYYNKQFKKQLLAKWRHVLLPIAEFSASLTNERSNNA